VRNTTQKKKKGKRAKSASTRKRLSKPIRIMHNRKGHHTKGVLPKRVSEMGRSEKVADNPTLAKRRVNRMTLQDAEV